MVKSKSPKGNEWRRRRQDWGRGFVFLLQSFLERACFLLDSVCESDQGRETTVKEGMESGTACTGRHRQWAEQAAFHMKNAKGASGDLKGAKEKIGAKGYGAPNGCRTVTLPLNN